MSSKIVWIAECGIWAIRINARGLIRCFRQWGLSVVACSKSAGLEDTPSQSGILDRGVGVKTLRLGAVQAQDVIDNGSIALILARVRIPRGSVIPVSGPRIQQAYSCRPAQSSRLSPDVEFIALDKCCSNELHEATLIDVRLKISGVSSIDYEVEPNVQVIIPGLSKRNFDDGSAPNHRRETDVNRPVGLDYP